MIFDYSKLRGRIVEKFGSQSRFATAMGWSERTTTLKMNNARTWKQSDICKASSLLEIKYSEIPEYFFKEQVQNIEQETA